LASLGFTLDDVRAFIQASQPTAELELVLKNLAARGLADFVKNRLQRRPRPRLLHWRRLRGFRSERPVFAPSPAAGVTTIRETDERRKVDLPALGFGMGDVVLCELLQAARFAAQVRPPQWTSLSDRR